MTTARQDIFNIRLAFNRGKIRHLMTGYSGRDVATIKWYIFDEKKAISAIDAAWSDKEVAVSIYSLDKAPSYKSSVGC